MRTSLLLAAALIGFAAPAFAQDRTLPAGAFDAVQAPIDSGIGYRVYAPSRSGGLSEGRSVAVQPAPVGLSHHRYR